MLLSTSLDDARASRFLGRVPWVTIALGLACAAGFAGARLAADEAGYLERREAAIRFWAERPYLPLPPALAARFGLVEADRAHLPRALVRPRPADPSPEAEALARLTAALVEAHDALPVRRLGLVPARGALQVGWLTAIFLHADAAHLLVNLALLLLAGPALEAAWGRPRFLAFFLAAGVVAGAAQALPMAGAETAIIGASGAVSACLGAMALRTWRRRTALGPAWPVVLLALVLGALWLLAPGGAGGDAEVAAGAHLGGFVFGLGAAALARAAGLEEEP